MSNTETDLLDLTNQYGSDTTLGRVVDRLRRDGVDVVVVQYRRGQCSCCYHPKWGDNPARVMIPVGEAHNQADDKPETFWRFGERTAGPTQYLGYEYAGGDEGKRELTTLLGAQIASAFHEEGLYVYWNGSGLQSIQIGQKRDLEAPLWAFDRAVRSLEDLTMVDAAIPGELVYGGEIDRAWPVMSEGVLYELVGKETARSVLARIRGLVESTGRVPAP